MAKIKVQITLEEDLLNQVDEYCDKNYMNRSWLISQSLVKVLNEQKVIDSLADISIALKKVAENGVMDENTKKKLEDFETLCKFFVGK